MLIINTAVWILILALVLDALIGDPDWLWRRIPHPVVLFGKVISGADNALNHHSFSAKRRKRDGFLLVILLTVCSFAIGLFLTMLLYTIPFGWILEALIVSVFIAQKSLYQHVINVYSALKTDGLEGGRLAVSKIVGRDPATLDEAGVSRSAIESLAENFSDGVIAPAFWYLLLGLPGLLAYKAINTADSMVGHLTEKHRDFGYASARFDDLLNLIPARLTGLLISVSAYVFKGYDGRQALRVMWADAGKHRSPNAGWPEAAMAGALGIALAGPRIYTSGLVADPYMNDAGRHDTGHEDIARALILFLEACGVWVLLLVLSGIIMI